MHVSQTAPANFWQVGRAMHVKKGKKGSGSSPPSTGEEKLVSLPGSELPDLALAASEDCAPVQI